MYYTSITPMRITALGQNPTRRDHNHQVLLGRMGGYHTGNSGCHRNPLWSNKSGQGRAAVTESLPATGCFCLSDICSSGIVLRSNRHKMMFPKGSTITATASLCSILILSSHEMSIYNHVTALLCDKLGSLLCKCPCFYPISPSSRKRACLKLRLFSSNCPSIPPRVLCWLERHTLPVP